MAEDQNTTNQTQGGATQGVTPPQPVPAPAKQQVAVPPAQESKTTPQQPVANVTVTPVAKPAPEKNPTPAPTTATVDPKTTPTAKPATKKTEASKPAPEDTTKKETNTPSSDSPEKKESKSDQVGKIAKTLVDESVKDQVENETFFGKLKSKWDAHVAGNKARAEARESADVDEELVTEEKSTTKSKNKKNSPASKPANSQSPIIIDPEFFENYDPKRDKKKLTPEMRTQIKEAEKLYETGVSSMKDLISPSSMEIKPNGMKLNGMHVKSFFIFNYPRYLETNWLNQIINFPTTMDVSIFIYPEDSGKLMRVLRKKVAEMRSSIRIQERKGTVDDVGVKVALQDAEELRENLQKGVERLFQIGLYITMYGEDKEKLENAVKQIQTILGGKLIMSRNADFRIERAFNATLPQATDEIEVLRNMNTGPASSTFPFVSNDLTSNEGVLYGLNRHNSSLIIFDRFNLANANSVVFATSGAGKSYAVKLEILRSLMFGTDVIILDPENEYQILCNTVGGTYINMSLTSPHRINPFDLPKPFDEKEANTSELIRENIITLSGLISLMLGTLTPQEESLMDKALFTCYEIKGITADIPNPSEYEMPTMNDLQKILASMEGGKDLADRLERYTNGTYAGLFGDQTNVDLNSGLICFCIRDLEPQLRPISMYILLNFIWSRVRSSLRKRLLVVDEAWNVVQHEDSGRFLHNLIKRARKYYMGISTITQDVEDFLDSPWGKPIITNSSMQMLLRQAPSAMEKLQPVFNLTDQEKMLLIGSGVGQGLFFAGNQHVAIEIISSFGEHKIITTKPEEVVALKNE